MIHIDNGVNKKAMEEVAEVVTSLFKASEEYSVSENNLGLALRLLGKTIKTGNVSISNCNLSTTLERNIIPSSEAVSNTLPSEEEEYYMHEEHVYRKIIKLKELAEAKSYTFCTYTTYVVMSKDGIEASVTIKEINKTLYEDLEKWLPKIS